MLVVSCFIASPQDSNRTPHSSVTAGSRISKGLDSNPNSDRSEPSRAEARPQEDREDICPLTWSEVQSVMLLIQPC